jgi:outer membrane protein assembly factor BamB
MGRWSSRAQLWGMTGRSSAARNAHWVSVAVWLVVVFVACSGALAEPANPPAEAEVPAGLHADDAFPDVYLNDSFAAHDALARAQQAARVGQWREAARTLQEAIDAADGQLMRRSASHYEGIRQQLTDVLCAWPAAGVEAYQAEFEPEARAQFAAAAERRSLDELLLLFERYFVTGAAADQADLIGQLAIEEGAFALAVRVYQRVLTEHPDRAEYESELRGPWRIALALRDGLERSTSGDDGGAAAAAEPSDRETAGSDAAVQDAGGSEDGSEDGGRLDERIAWKGRDATLGEVLAELSGDFVPDRLRQRDANVWPLFGGANGRSQPAGPTVTELGLLWQVNPFHVDETEDEGFSFDDPFGVQDSTRALSVNPVVVGTRMFLQQGRQIAAVDLASGDTIWHYGPDGARQASADQMDAQVPAWHSVTYADGRIYAAFAADSLATYYETPGRDGELVCIRARDGQSVWRLNRATTQADLEQTSFDSAPLVVQDRVYVVARRRLPFGFEDCYLLRLDAKTGRIVFRTHIGSASTGTFGARRATLSVATYDAETVYVCTNLGSVAAVDAFTGSVRWLRLYRTERDEASEQWRRASQRRSWSYQPPICAGDRLICLPTDTPEVLLLSREDGELLRSRRLSALAGMEGVVGVRGSTLIGAGSALAAWDFETDELLWRVDWPRGQRLFGRGIWAGSQVLIPLRDGLAVAEAATGQIEYVEWAPNQTGGNLLGLPDMLLVAGPEGTSAYVHRQTLWRELRARLAADPHDPTPAVEWANAALRANDAAEALQAVTELAGRIEGLPTPERAPMREVLRTLAVSVGEIVVASSDAEGATPRHRDEDEAGRRDVEGKHSADNADSAVDAADAADAVDAEVAVAQLEQLWQLVLPESLAVEVNAAHRLQFADWFAQLGAAGRAVELYQAILQDSALRPIRRTDSTLATPTAGQRSRAEIRRLLAAHGHELYEPFEALASQAFDKAKEGGDESAVAELIEVYPFAEATGRALLDRATKRAAGGSLREAADAYAEVYHRFPGQRADGALLGKLLDAYHGAGADANVYRWLCHAAEANPDQQLTMAGTTATAGELLDQGRPLRARFDVPTPSLDLPLDESWERSFDGPITLLTPWFDGYAPSRADRWYVYQARAIRAFAAQGGREVWTAPVGAPGDVVLLVTTAEYAVFAGQQEVFAVNVEDGGQRWRFAERGAGSPDEEADDWEAAAAFRTSALSEDRLALVREGGHLSCLRLEDGSPLWSIETGFRLPGPMAVLSPWLVITTMEQGRNVLCVLDAATGEVRDVIQTEERRPAEALHLTHDGKAILLTSQSAAAYNLSTGGQEWRSVLRGHIRPPSVIFRPEGLYLSRDGRRMQRWSLLDGAVRWESQAVTANWDDSLTAELHGDTIIASTTEGVLGLDARTGNLLWRGTTGDDPHFVRRLLTDRYVVALEMQEDRPDAEDMLFFYDHAEAHGMLPAEGGTLSVGRLRNLRAVEVLEQAVIVQTGSTIQGWSHRR